MNGHYGRPQSLTLGLASLNALLILAVMTGMRSTGELPAEQASGTIPAQPDRMASLPIAQPPIQQYEEIVARPIFSETRRPDAALLAAAPQVDSPFSLKGVVITAEVRQVWLARKGNPEIVKVMIGQSIDGWEVDAIEQEHVRLRKSGQTLVLALDRPMARQPAIAPQRQKR
jgi:general secretion pathway protein N